MIIFEFHNPNMWLILPIFRRKFLSMTYHEDLMLRQKAQLTFIFLRCHGTFDIIFFFFIHSTIENSFNFIKFNQFINFSFIAKLQCRSKFWLYHSIIKKKERKRKEKWDISRYTYMYFLVSVLKIIQSKIERSYNSS